MSWHEIRTRHDITACRCGCYGCKFHCAAHWRIRERIAHRITNAWIDWSEGDAVTPETVASYKRINRRVGRMLGIYWAREVR